MDEKVNKVGRPPKDETLVPVTTMVPTHIRDEIDEAADADKRSRSDWLRLLIERSVQ
jgi:hypothetical protein